MTAAVEPTLLEAFGVYERRFARAVVDQPPRHPLRNRGEIRGVVKRCLGIRDEWIPAMRTEVVRTTAHDGICIQHLAGTSWPEVQAAAHLYLPTNAAGAGNPFVLLCCGHGKGCKLNPGYQAMARHLARQGACVLVADNIGQGERAFMGHREPVAPFACGTSVQGLIVLEALGWLAWARADERFDNARMGAAGNSGGGHLTRHLAALEDDLAAISSSGQASTIAYTAQKERRLCHCAIVPGIVGQLEMWQQYACFAPRPLFLFNGRDDHMFPWDLFWQTARKVRAVYAEAGAGDRCRAETPAGGHSWDSERRELLGAFFQEALELPRPGMIRPEDEEDLLDPASGACLAREGRNTDDLARSLTAVDAPAGLALWDVFPPRVSVQGGAMLSRHTNQEQRAQIDVRQIFAQFEAFLKPVAG